MVVVVRVNLATLTGCSPDTANRTTAVKGMTKHRPQDGIMLVPGVSDLVEDLVVDLVVVDWDRFLFFSSFIGLISILIFFALGGLVLGGSEKLGLAWLNML